MTKTQWLRGASQYGDVPALGGSAMRCVAAGLSSDVHLTTRRPRQQAELETAHHNALRPFLILFVFLALFSSLLKEGVLGEKWECLLVQSQQQAWRGPQTSHTAHPSGDLLDATLDDIGECDTISVEYHGDASLKGSVLRSNGSSLVSDDRRSMVTATAQLLSLSGSGAFYPRVGKQFVAGFSFELASVAGGWVFSYDSTTDGVGYVNLSTTATSSDHLNVTTKILRRREFLFIGSGDNAGTHDSFIDTIFTSVADITSQSSVFFETINSCEAAGGYFWDYTPIAISTEEHDCGFLFAENLPKFLHSYDPKETQDLSILSVALTFRENTFEVGGTAEGALLNRTAEEYLATYSVEADLHLGDVEPASGEIFRISSGLNDPSTAVLQYTADNVSVAEVAEYEGFFFYTEAPQFYTTSVVVYAHDNEWAKSELALRVVLSFVVIFMIVCWIIRAVQNFSGPGRSSVDTPFPALRSGEGGTANALSLWLLFLLIAYFLNVNCIAPFANDAFWRFLDAHSEAIYFMAQNSFCIAFIRVCYYSCKGSTKSWLFVCYPAICYAVGGLLLHFFVSYYFADEISCGDPNGMGISFIVYPASRPVCLDMECPGTENGTYAGSTASSSGLRWGKRDKTGASPLTAFLSLLAFHMFFLLYGLRVYIKLTFFLLPSVPFSPNACPFLLVRWFSYFGVIYITLLLGIFLHLYYTSRDGGGTAMQGNNKGLGNTFSNTTFLFFIVVACFPLSRRRVKVKGDTASETSQEEAKGFFLNAITMLRDFADGFSLGRIVCGTKDNDDTFSDTITSVHTSCGSLHTQAAMANALRVPFCLESADWLWAVSWEVTAADPRIFFEWHSVGAAEAAAIAACDGSMFEQYARRYANPFYKKAASETSKSPKESEMRSASSTTTASPRKRDGGGTPPPEQQIDTRRVPNNQMAPRVANWYKSRCVTVVSRLTVEMNSSDDMSEEADESHSIAHTDSPKPSNAPSVNDSELDMDMTPKTSPTGTPSRKKRNRSPVLVGRQKEVENQNELLRKWLVERTGYASNTEDDDDPVRRRHRRLYSRASPRGRPREARPQRPPSVTPPERGLHTPRCLTPVLSALHLSRDNSRASSTESSATPPPEKKKRRRQPSSLVRPKARLRTKQNRLRLSEQGHQQEGVQEKAMNGATKSKYLMDWERVGMTTLLPVVSVGQNQSCVACSSTTIAVSFRGTINIDNVKSDLHACSTKVSPINMLDPFAAFTRATRLPFVFTAVPMRLHTGFLSIWEKHLRSTTVQHLIHLLASEGSAQTLYGARAIERRTVYITGHSLGGALASLCAYDVQVQVIHEIDGFLESETSARAQIISEWAFTLETELMSAKCAYSEDLFQSVVADFGDWLEDDVKPRRPRQVIVYTFGSPKVGNREWMKVYDKALPNTFRVVNGEDAVPTMPPSGVFGIQYRHVGQLVLVC